MAKRSAKAAQIVVAKAVGDSASSSVAGYEYSSGQRLPTADIYWLLYTKHPWVSACVNLIANTVANDGYAVHSLDEEEIDNSEQDERVASVRLFFRSAFSGSSLRRAMVGLAIDMKVFGVAFWRKKRAGGALVGLERIDPRLCQPKPNDERTEIEEFRIRKVAPAFSLGQGALPMSLAKGYDAVKPEDMVFFSMGGGDPLLGAPSPLESLDLTIALDLAVRRHRESFFRNGAVAGTILVNESATEKEVRAAERMLERTKARPENAYRTWLLTGEWKVHVKASGSGDKDYDFVKASDINRDEICAAYHVPPGKLLFASGALGQAGKAEDDATFQAQCVLPLEETIYETLTREILVADMDLADLQLVPKRRHSIRLDMFSAALELVKFGGTGNEARELVNLPRIEIPGVDMDVPLFITHTGKEVSSDEPLGDVPSGSAAAALPAGKASGNGRARRPAKPPKTPQNPGFSRETQDAKAAAKRPNLAVWRRKSQRLVGRLHEKLLAIVEPKLREAGAASQQSTKAGRVDMNTVLQDISDAIAAGYSEQEALGRALAEAYRFRPGNVDKRIRDAAELAYRRQRDYVQESLGPYLRDVGRQVESGEAAVGDVLAGVSNRLEMYAESGWNVFQQSQGIAAEDAGVELDWVLDEASEHCEDCPDNAEGGPYTEDSLPSWPGDGGTACGSRCNCELTPTAASWADYTARLDAETEGEFAGLREGFS